MPKSSRQILREQREQVEREHAEERLLQRRAEAAAAKPSPPDQAGAPGPVDPAPIVAEPSPQEIRPRPDFSFPLMARSAAAGLLAGLCVFLVGRFFERRLNPAH